MKRFFLSATMFATFCATAQTTKSDTARVRVDSIQKKMKLIEPGKENFLMDSTMEVVTQGSDVTYIMHFRQREDTVLTLEKCKNLSDTVKFLTREYLKSRVMPDTVKRPVLVVVDSKSTVKQNALLVPKTKKHTGIKVWKIWTGFFIVAAAVFIYLNVGKKN